jgi:hypothetical protein
MIAAVIARYVHACMSRLVCFVWEAHSIGPGLFP